MKSLLLSPDFNPFGSAETIPFKAFNFHGGEVHIKLASSDKHVRIATRLNNSDAVMQLLLAVDALRRSGATEIQVFIPYLPYARQDRVMVQGEPLSIKVFANLINSCHFSKVYVYDVHSEVSLALLDHAEGIYNHSLVQSVVYGDYWLVSPDAGALKKIYGLAQHLNYQHEIVLCNKVRDVSTGEIRQISVDKADLSGRDCYIVDDICDGGATFISIAKELRARNAGKVNLIVSHGIFSHGEAELGKWIDKIYTTDSISNAGSGLIERISLSNLINL